MEEAEETAAAAENEEAMAEAPLEKVRKPRLLIPVSSHKKPFNVFSRTPSSRMPLRRIRLFSSLVPHPDEFPWEEDYASQQEQYEPFPADWVME